MHELNYQSMLLVDLIDKLATSELNLYQDEIGKYHWSFRVLSSQNLPDVEDGFNEPLDAVFHFLNKLIHVNELVMQKMVILENQNPNAFIDN